MAMRCAECNKEVQKCRRDRCDSCYRRHVKALKQAGEFTPLSSGHQARPAIERLLSKVDVAPSGCWLYSGHLDPQGYGRITDDNGKTSSVHRMSYVHHSGPIPPGLQVDHECHNLDIECVAGPRCVHRRCINPEHLRLATPRDNILRGRTVAAGNRAKTRCRQGHEYTPENTRVLPSGRRICRACQQIWSKSRPAKGLTPRMTHGKRSTYTQGQCRCEPCKAAERAHWAARCTPVRSPRAPADDVPDTP